MKYYKHADKLTVEPRLKEHLSKFKTIEDFRVLEPQINEMLDGVRNLQSPDKRRHRSISESEGVTTPNLQINRSDVTVGRNEANYNRKRFEFIRYRLLALDYRFYVVFFIDVHFARLDVIRSVIVQLQQRLVKIAERALAVVFAAVQLEIDLKRQSIVLTISSNSPNRSKIHNRIRNRCVPSIDFQFSQMCQFENESNQ